VDVLLGNGDGTFGPPISSSIQESGDGIAVDDFNRDGKLDLALSDQTGFAVYKGNGDGTFQAPITTTAMTLAPLRSGDLNGDGYPDLAGVNNKCLGVLFGNGDGTFQPEIDWDLNYPYDVKIADFNQDGKLDLLAVQYYQRVGLLRNLGNGNFATAEPYAFSTSPFGAELAIGDFNHDGFPDLVAPVMGNFANIVDIMMNSGAR
jgi:hypothetical protein